MKELGITMDELTYNYLMVEGFNQGEQKIIIVIRFNFMIEDMSTSALFHVIEAKTTYNMLLG